MGWQRLNLYPSWKYTQQKIHEKMILSTLHIRQQRTVIFEKWEINKVSPSFATAQGWLTRCNMGARARESRSFLTLRGQRWGLSERPARVVGDRMRAINGFSEIFRGSHLCRSMLISIRKLPKAGAEPPKGIRGNSTECSYRAGYAACSY